MLVVLGMLVLIVILIGYIAFSKTPAADKIEEVKKKAEKMKTEEVSEHRKTPKLAYCPVISYRSPGETSYERVEMSRPKITIGSGKNCDIRLEDETVEKIHATIEKVVKGNDVYYEFINLSKFNPAEYLNTDNGGKREYLGFKKGVVIKRAEGFKVGETKVFVEIPSREENRLSVTERQFLDKRTKLEDEEKTDACEDEEDTSLLKSVIWEDEEDDEDMSGEEAEASPAKTIRYNVGEKDR